MAEKEDLASQAYLYAGGELNEAEREAFEQRLALEQPAREALADAVQMSLSLAGREPSPDLEYRVQVRRRLRPAWWLRLLDRRSYPGHPLLWAVAGAAASLLLALTVLRPGPEIHVVQRPAEPLQVPEHPDGAAEEGLEDMACIWAELSTPDHVLRTHAEEQRRKTRLEDRRLSRRGNHLPNGH